MKFVKSKRLGFRTMLIGKYLISAALLIVLSMPAVNGQELTGEVISVADGDTLTILGNKQLIRVRLSGIDCPEKRQAFGQKVNNLYTSVLSYNKTVTLRGHGKDRYGRTLADVLLPDRRNSNQELLSAGYAWWYRQYAPGQSELSNLEGQARRDKQGLWIDPNPIPPWEDTTNAQSKFHLIQRTINNRQLNQSIKFFSL